MKHTKLFNSFLKDTRGQFAVWFAIIGLPMAAGVTYSIEHLNARDTKTELIAALDAAALASVLNQQLTPTEREAFAQNYFSENFHGSKAFTLEVRDAAADRVELYAKGSIETSVAGAFGVNTILIAGESVALKTIENTICVLTLNPDGDDSFLVEKGSDFSANGCSVQVNSKHPFAARVDNASYASAKSFCAHGGTVGLFSPYANSECSIVLDPFVSLVPPAPLPCNGLGLVEEALIGKDDDDDDYDDDDNDTLDHLDKHAEHYDDKHHIHRHSHNGVYHTHNHQKFKHHALSEGLNNPIISPRNFNSMGIEDVSEMEASVRVTAMDDAVLYPGTYCDGIRVSGEGVKFMPGQYDVYKGIFFKEGGESVAENVVFVFHGDLTELKVEAGASVNITAPSEGKMGGIAFYHKPKTNNELPIGTNTLKGGGNLQISGTAYFPYHTIEVGNGHNFGAHAPATSYISYNAHFTEGSRIVIESDHVEAGLPPLEPRSDSAARLER